MLRCILAACLGLARPTAARLLFCSTPAAGCSQVAAQADPAAHLCLLLALCRRAARHLHRGAGRIRQDAAAGRAPGLLQWCAPALMLPAHASSRGQMNCVQLCTVHNSRTRSRSARPAGLSLQTHTCTRAISNMTHLLPAVCAMRAVQASPSTLRAWAAGMWSCSSRWSRCALLRLLCVPRAAGRLRWPANGPKQRVHRGCCEWNALISVKWRQMSRCAAPTFYYMLPLLTTCPPSPAPLATASAQVKGMFAAARSS